MTDETQYVPFSVPRRNQMLTWCEAEHRIFEAVQVVEVMGADERLTDAVVLLGAARDRVADFIDGVTGKRTVPAPAQSHSPCPTCGGPHFYGRGTAHFDGCKHWDALNRSVKPPETVGERGVGGPPELQETVRGLLAVLATMNPNGPLTRELFLAKDRVHDALGANAAFAE